MIGQLSSVGAMPAIAPIAPVVPTADTRSFGGENEKGSSLGARSDGSSRSKDPSLRNQPSIPGVPSSSEAEALEGKAGNKEAAKPGETPDAEKAKQTGSEKELSAEEQRKLASLKRRDIEVRQHERAHASAGGSHAGSPQYEYERGPDGRMYAVGGHVSVDMSPASTPEATLRKMEQIQRAALAPASPSGQDRRVAAQAASRAAQARQDIQAEQRTEQAEASSRATQSSDESIGEGSASPEISSQGSQVLRGEIITRLAKMRAASEYQATMRYSAQSAGTGIDVLACQNCGGSHSA